MNTFLFLIMLAVSSAVTAVFLHEIRNDLNGSEKPSKKLSAVRRASRAAALLLVLAAAAQDAERRTARQRRDARRHFDSSWLHF